MFNNQIIAGSSGQGGGSFYPVTIDDSLRFEDGSSANLSRTPASAGSLTTWTWSGWVKRGNLAAGMPARGTIFSGSGGPTVFGFMNPTTNGAADNFGAYISTGEDDRFMTNRVFRDTSWYHLVVVWDSTNGTAGDRFRLYVNGVRETSWSRFDTVTQNRTAGINAAALHGIGVQANAGSQYFDGYLSDIYLIDGQALDATSFGETKDGVWIPKSYSGSYGTNGFHLELNGNTNDASGNGNNWTANNISAHDYVPDSPTNNFATYNINVNTGQSLTYEEGNLNNSASGSFWSSSVWQQSSLGITGGANAGKYYFEYCTTTSGSGQATGVAVQSSSAIDTVSHNDGVIYYNTAVKTGNTVTVSGISNNPTYDVLRFAFDASNGKVWIGNSTGWFNSGNPAAGTGESGTIANYDGLVLVAVTNRTTIASDHIFNFGQDSTFAGFKASGSANGSDDNGIGDFYYNLPSGFLALCSANLPDLTIGPGQTALAEDYFVPYLYTADNTSPRSFTGLGFQADFLWFKDRTTAFSHGLYDTIRGPNKQLQTNNTSAENSYTLLPSFDADGFTTQTDGTAGNVLNYSTDSYVTWAWKAGGTPTATNSAGAGAVPTSGSVLIDGVASTSTLAGTIAANKITANTAAGFSIINYTGNGLSGQTVAHSLSSTPEFLIHKDRGTNSNNNQWNAWHLYAGDGDDYGYLSLANAFTGAAQMIPNGTDTIELKANITTSNQSGHSFIMYAFHSVDGYSKIGKWVGNGNINGPFVYTGFRPSYILTKRSDGTSWWGISDSKRSPFNEVANTLAANESYTESVLTSDLKVDFLSNGFKIRDTSAYYNANGGNYIYLAFAETPAKFANAR